MPLVKIQAAVLREFELSKPYAASKPLSVEDIELDEPGYGEALVRIESAGVCHSDLSTIEGILFKTLPLALGHEAAGVVERVGPDVSRVAPGDHVVFSFVPNCGRCTPCGSGRPALCEPGNRANATGALLRDGRRLHANGADVLHHLGVSGFATHAVAAEESLVRIDPDVPLGIAALFGCAALTGLGAVFEAARVAPGTTVAIFGGGGVGLMAALGTNIVGATAIVVDPVPHKRDVAQSLGARATVDPSAGEVSKQIRALNGGRGVEYAIEASGTVSAFQDAIACTAPGGTVVAIGLPRGAASRSLSCDVGQRRSHRARFVHGILGAAARYSPLRRALAPRQASHRAPRERYHRFGRSQRGDGRARFGQRIAHGRQTAGRDERSFLVAHRLLDRQHDVLVDVVEGNVRIDDAGKLAGTVARDERQQHEHEAPRARIELFIEERDR